MRFVSFFAGLGGLDIALESLGCVTVGQVELEPHCRRVLEARWPGVWRGGDITVVDPEWIPEADIWCGGFPCQGVSAAGKGRGLDDARSGLWHVWARLIAARRPRWVFIENSPLLRTRGLNRVLADLHGAGYDARWCRRSAWDVGAWHWRERMWVLAGPRGSWDPPGLLPDVVLEGELPGDGLMAGDGGGVYRMPVVTGGKPPSASSYATPTARDGMTGSSGDREDGDKRGRRLRDIGRHPLQTATAGDAKASGSRNLAGSGARPGTSLTDYLAFGGGRVPRRLALPSAAARDVRSGKGRQENGHAPQLPEVLGGVLNPAWVETFMGYPEGWTDPERPTETLEPHAEWMSSTASPTLPPRSLPCRRERIKALGNAVVPQCAAAALRVLAPALLRSELAACEPAHDLGV